MMELSDRACEDLWTRVQAKKYAYGHDRGQPFINRCERIQRKLDMIRTLAAFEAEGIKVADVLEGHLIWMQRKFVNGKSENME